MDVINNKLLKDIQSYCEINNLKLEDYVNSLLKKAFMLEKYGERPPIYGVKTGKENPIEVIKEPTETNYTVNVEIPKKKKAATRRPKKEKPVEEEVIPAVEEKTEGKVDTPIIIKEDKDIKPKKRKLTVK